MAKPTSSRTLMPVVVTAWVPLAVAWVADHSVQAAAAASITPGGLGPATPLRLQILIWVPAWAIAISAGVVAAAARQRGVTMRPGGALRAVALRARRVAPWFLPYAVVATVPYWWSTTVSGLSTLNEALLTFLAVLVLAVIAWRRFRTMLVLPVRLLGTGQRPRVAAARLRRESASVNARLALFGLLMAPLPLALVLDAIGDGVTGVAGPRIGPLVAGIMSAIQLLALAVLVAGQSTTLARWYLEREPGDPAPEVDAAVAGSAGSVSWSWLVAFALPAVLLASVAGINPARLPVMQVRDAPAGVFAIGLDPADRPVLVTMQSVIRCRDAGCDMVSTTPIPSEIVAASVASDGTVLAIRLPGYDYSKGPAQLVECPAAGDCVQRDLGLPLVPFKVIGAAVVRLPAGGLLVVAAYGDNGTAQPTGPVGAWACTSTCSAVPVDNDGVRIGDMGVLTAGRDAQGVPVIVWHSSYDEPEGRISCDSAACDRLLVQPIRPTSQSVGWPVTIAGDGVDRAGNLVFVAGRRLHASGTGDFCPCFKFPLADQPVLSTVTCDDAICGSVGRQQHWTPVSRWGVEHALVAYTADGRPVVVYTESFGEPGSLAICLAHCDPA